MEDRKGKNAPDFLISGLIWEAKTINTTNIKNGIQAAIKRGKKQASRILIRLPKRFKKRDLWQGLYNAIALHDQKEKVKSILLVFPEGKMVELSTEDIRKGHISI